MKIRNGFVSNSSSSSFIILKSNLNDRQKDFLYKHIQYGKEVDDKLKEEGEDPIYEYYEDWNISESEYSIWCRTTMDNFDLELFLTREANVPTTDIVEMGDGWGSYNVFEDDEYMDYIMRIRSEKIKTLKNNIENG